MSFSTLRSLLYQFIIGSMIFYITTEILQGIESSGYALHWLMAFGVYNAAIYLVPHTIRFLTLPRNLLTYWLMSAISGFAAMYAISMFVPGITFNETIIDPVKLGVVSVDPFTLSADLTMIAAAVVSGLFNALLTWLRTDAYD